VEPISLILSKGSAPSGGGTSGRNGMMKNLRITSAYSGPQANSMNSLAAFGCGAFFGMAVGE